MFLHKYKKIFDLKINTFLLKIHKHTYSTVSCQINFQSNIFIYLLCITIITALASQSHCQHLLESAELNSNTSKCRLDSLLISGNTIFTFEQIAESLHLTIDSTFDEESFFARLDQFKKDYEKLNLGSVGWNVKITHIKRTPCRVQVTIAIAENEWIKKISFKGSTMFSLTHLNAFIKSCKDCVFDKELILLDIIAIKNLYDKNGIKDVEVGYTSSGLHEITVEFTIQEQNVLKEIMIKGARYYSKSAIMKKLNVAKGKVLSISQLNQARNNLIRDYKNSGFFNIEIEVEILGSDCFIKIEENNRFKIKNFLIKNHPRFSDDTLGFILGIQPGEYYNTFRIENGIQELLTLYENCGYPFADVKTDSIWLDSGYLNLSLTITENMKYFFGDIYIGGNTRTRPGVIQRQLSLKKGDIFRQELLTKDREKLIQLGLFKEVYPFGIKLKHNKRQIDILLNIEEAKNSIFEGLFGISPNDTGQIDYSAYFDLDLKNISGTERMLKLYFLYEKTQKFSDFKLIYEEPWIFKLPVYLGGELLVTMQAPLYFHIETFLNQKMPVGHHIHTLVKIGRIRQVVSNQSDSGLPNDSSSFTTYAGEIGLNIDRRKPVQNPRRGFLLQTSLGYAQKIKTSEKYNEVRYKINSRLFANPFSSHVGLVSLNLLDLISAEKNLGLWDKYRIGGFQTVRGYREKEISGKRLFFSNFEYRYLIGKYSHMLLFYDLAVNLKSISGFSRDLLGNNSFYGYGLGAQFMTQIGSLNLIYAVGRDDDLSNGKVHVGIKNHF
ncbi:MAG: POTRA domain-containing protein [bacterium]